MAGTQAGGKNAAETNKSRYGKDFYVRIGAKGGKIGRSGGFGSLERGSDGLTGRERARQAGRAGGLKSKRGSKTPIEVNTSEGETI